VDYGVQRFVFSSTAAVYGMPETSPVPESCPPEPINPYGRSKLMTEWVLQDAAAAHQGPDYVILRYFNVAGADPEGRLGQSTPEATHLVKAACRTALGLQEALDIFGTDYPTPDGTGIRDYIHVMDLAEAHVRALDYLAAGGQSRILNCGYGRGYSVREVAAALEGLTGRPLPTRYTGRRAGDPARLVADPSQLQAVFHWQPRYASLETIVQTAFDWERGRPY
jgi:UDP-glucose 4-epimerase